MSRRPELLILACLAAIAALEPVSTQMLLPALPSIQAHFGAAAGTTQLTLSVALLVMAFTDLIYGPWSDRVGRRPIVLFGVVLFLGGNLLSALAPRIGVVIVGRAIQAAGVSVGIVLFRAIAIDLYQGEKASSVIALTQAIVSFGTLLAPVTSGMLTDEVGWRSTFAALSVLGVFVLILVAFGLKESHRRGESGERGLSQILGDYAVLGKRPLFAAYGMHSAFTFGIFFAFMASAPHVVMSIFGEDATSFGLWMLLAVGGFIAGNLFSVRWGGRIGADRMIVAGTLICVVMPAVAMGLIASGYWAAGAIFVPGAFVTLGAGMATPSSQSLAVRAGRDRAGTASGLVGFLLLVVGGIAVQVAGWTQNETPYPMLLILQALALLSLGAIGLRMTALRESNLPAYESST